MKNRLFLQTLSQSFSELRFLAVYTYPELRVIWAYDFRQAAYNSDPRLTQALAQVLSPESDELVFQLVQYSEGLEALLRCGDRLISCISGRKNMNARLLEHWLRQQREPLLELAASSLDTGKRRKTESGPKTEKTTAASLSVRQSKGPVLSQTASKTASQAVSWKPPKFRTYEALKLVKKSPQAQNIQLRARSDGKLFLARLIDADALSPMHWQSLADRCANPSGQLNYQLSQETDGNQTLLIRPWASGVSLETLVNRVGQLSFLQSRLLLEQICQQLKPFHLAGRGHLNLSPSNILITPERKVVLVDSGLSLIQTQVKAAARLAGNASFLAPEQLRGKTALTASDSFTLGALWVYMLCGAPALAGLPGGNAPAKRVEKMKSLARKALENVSPKASLLAEKLLAIDVPERPADGFELLKSLQMVK